MSSLLNVDDAIAQILETILPLTAESVRLNESLGRVLAEDIVSNENLPPFDNSSMDGFAIRAADSVGASSDTPITLRVVMDVPAGVSPEQTLGVGEAARIMTGAPIPDGADAVIPVEETDSDFSQLGDAPLPEQVMIYAQKSSGDSVRPVGENIRQGQTVLAHGRVIRPADVGMLAAIGKVNIPVIRKPRVVIVGSGDELVDVDAPVGAGQIRDVNSYTIEAMIREYGGEAIRLPIAPDNAEALRNLFETALSYEPDMIVSSAGVSVGAADYVRAILDEMGNIGFWKINLRPGKPLAFGDIRGVPFFGLPGNPVSVMVTFHVLVAPALRKMAGLPNTGRVTQAVVGETMRSDGRRTFARVTLTRDGDKLIAHETGTQSSGALMSFVLADGLLVIPDGVREVDAGMVLDVHLLRDIEN